MNRRVLILFFLMLSLDARALITNNLAADWQAGVGMTISSNRVSQWNDQHYLLNNDGITNNLTQSSASLRPVDFIDSQNFHGVMFPWAPSSAHPNTYLTIPNSLSGMRTTNMTVYVVATGPFDQERTESLVAFNGVPSWISFFLDGAYPAYYPAGMVVGARNSTHPVVYPSLNRGVFVGCSDNITTTIRWNNVTQTNLPQSVATISTGGTIGINNSVPGGTEYGYCGVVYRILVYKQAHTGAQMNAQVAELAALYNIVTNYTRKVVCRGDSIVEGVDSTNLQNYPFQLCQRYPEIEWHNQGIGGTYIGNSNIVDSMYAVDGNFVDPLYDPAAQQNWLFFFGGANDVRSGGVTPIGTYTRLTNYVAARKSSRQWKVVQSTIHAIYGVTNVAGYNDCIRTNGGPWDRLVDPGMNSPIEKRLNDPTDTNYYFYPGASGDQGVHLINAGYKVLADHFGQVINVPHRSTGFSGP